MQLLEEQTGPVFQLVTARQQQPTLFSFEVKGFVARTCSEFRKLTAFAGTAIAIGHMLTQVVQHSAKPQRPMPDWLIPGFRSSSQDISGNCDRYFGPRSPMARLAQARHGVTPLRRSGCEEA
jgi:hypothetical protein